MSSASDALRRAVLIAALVVGRAAAQADPGASEPADRRVHALERTLVERGGLLLEPGRFELVPELAYANSDNDAVLAPDGTLLAAQTHRFTGGITLRLGLPLRFQAEGEFPFAYVERTARPSGATPQVSHSGRGLGDIRLGLTLHVIKTTSGFPDVLLSGFWKSRTGASPLDGSATAVGLGSGIEQFGGGVALVKALDPVVLLVSATGTESVPRKVGDRWIDPRAELGIRTSVILAVSPETSLSFGLEQAYSQTLQVSRVDVPGTNRTAAVFDVGFATLASRYGLLEVTLGMGLTEDVPRFQLALATPLQF